MVLYRHILAEHIAPFLYSIGIVTFIFIMDLAIQLMDSILTKGLNPKVVFEVFFLNLAWMTALSVPMGVLIAVLIAFGRLSADNEITALKASGVSIYRMIVPSVMLALVIGVGMVFFNNTVLPESNHKVSILLSDIHRKKPAAFLRAGTILSDFEGYRILIEKLDHKASTFENIKIYEDNRRDPPSTTYAENGSLQYLQNGDFLQFTLFDGETHQYDRQNPDRYYVVKFQKQVINIKNTEHKLQRTSREYRSDREMSVPMMRKRIARKKKEQNEVTQSIGKHVRDHHQEFIHLSKYEPTGESIDPYVSQAKSMTPIGIDSALAKHKPRIREQAKLLRIHQDHIRYVNRYLVEIHKKYSIPAACLVFVFIGAPLGIKARSGGLGVGTAYSIAFFLLYWACFIGGETLADKNIVPPFWAMWAPNFLVGGFGMILLFSVVRETTFFSYSWLGAWARRLAFGRSPQSPKGDNTR